MKKVLFSLLFITIAFQTFAQQPKKSITLMYKISAEEALEFNQEKGQSTEYLQAKYLHSYVDSFHYKKFHPKLDSLSSGYYLFVKASKGDLMLSLHGFHDYHFKLVNREEDLVVQVLDTLSRVQENAKVYFNNRLLRYYSAEKTHERPKTRKEGMLKIEINGQTLFYAIEPERNTTKWERFLTQINHYQWGRKRRIRKYKRNSKKVYQLQKEQCKGYIMVNQPKYRYGDTVKVKAYIANTTGKPLTQPLAVAVYSSNLNYTKQVYQKTPLIMATVTPNLKGNYTYEFVLGDSLDLDKTYYVHFMKPFEGKERATYFAQSFYLEDYELDKIQYKFWEADQKEIYYPKDKILFMASAKNQNGQFIADGTLRLTITRDKVNYIENQSIRIADTLWQTTLDLSSKGPTPILIPWKKIPKADIDLEIQAEFYNSSGEYEQRSRNINAYHLPNYLEIKLEGNEIVCQYFQDSVSVPIEATFYAYNDDNDIEVERKVQLPYRQTLNPQVEYYEIETEDDFEELYLQYLESKVRVFGNNTGDSIFVTISNPLKVPVQYSIYKVNKLITRGSTAEDYWRFEADNSNESTYSILYTYPWGGIFKTQNSTFNYFDNNLQVEITQPQKVMPGEAVTVKVKVTDKDKTPQPMTNLAASAINSAFANNDQYTTSGTSGTKYPKSKRFKDNIYFDYDDIIGITKSRTVTPYFYQPFKGNSYFDYDDIGITKSRTVTPYFYQKLELENHKYYQICHPKESILMKSDSLTSDTFYEEYAQFAPYLVKNGRMQPIIFIYCNHELVYFSGTAKHRPYSFVGKAGYNVITIRTYDKVYTIKNVFLKKGHKLDLSIDIDKYQAHPFAKNIEVWEANNKEFEDPELEMLNQTMMVLSHSNENRLFLWQSHSAIHDVSHSYQTRIVGPFQKGKMLHYVMPNEFQKAIKFESGFEYEIDKNRDLLRETHYFTRNKRIRHYKYTPPKVGELILKPSNIIFKHEKNIYAEIRTALRKRFSLETNMENYEYKITPYSKGRKINYSVWLKEGQVIDALYNSNAGKKELPAGDYTILFYKHDSTFAKHDFTISRDTLLYEKLDFNQLIFQLDTNLQQLNAFAKTLTTKPIDDISTYLSETQIVPNGTNKVIIQGKITDIVSKEGLIAATILIKDSSDHVIAGVITDLKGKYSVALDEGVYKVLVSYTGYTTQKTFLFKSQIGNTLELNFELKQGKNIDNVTINSGNTRMHNWTGSIDNSSVEQGNLASKSTFLSGALSYTVDADGDTDDYDILVMGYASGVPGAATSVQRTSYKESAILTPRFLDNEDNFDTEAYLVGSYDMVAHKTGRSSVRSNFQDYAFWQPNLITDQNGEAYFNVTFPDNITKWQTTVVGMDRKARLGFGFTETQSYKPVTGQLSLPRFLITGDKADIVGKAMNLTNDTFNIQTQFKQGDHILTTKKHQLTDGIVEKTTISMDAPTDKFKLTYQLTSDKFSDGEQRDIPVFEKGVLENVGDFWVLDSDTTFQYQVNNQMGNVQVSVQSNALDILIGDIQRLKVYPYDCNEQVASKLMALLLEQEVNTQLNLPFEGKKAIRKAIATLRKTQNSNGSWGWWKDGEANVMMTIHITKSLLKAAEYQYVYNQNYYNPIAKTIDFLITDFYTFTKSSQYQVLSLFAQIESEYDVSKMINDVDRQNLTLFQQMVIIQAQQQSGLKYSLDSLEQHRQQTTFGGSYFGKEGYWWFDNSIPLTLLAYDIYKNAKREDICKSIRQYFFEQRRHNGWRNTYETAQILATILPDVLNDKNEQPKNTLTINGNTIDLNNKNTQINYSDKVLNIKKTGNAPLFITAYQQFQNPSPKAKSDVFEVKTAFQQKGKTLNKSNIQLAQNTPVHIIVTVKVKEAADYVMIEVPLPAGCSYDAKPQSFGNYEVHREYFRNKTAIFCQQLPVGEYTFRIPLQARFIGDYTVNPAKVEQMYFPVFYGRNEGKVVEVR